MRTIDSPTDVQILEEQIARQIDAIFLERLSIRVDSADTDLFQSGILDSMTLVRFILHLEQVLQLQLPMEDVELDSFRSVRSIAKLIADRKWADVGAAFVKC